MKNGDYVTSIGQTIFNIFENPIFVVKWPALSSVVFEAIKYD